MLLLVITRLYGGLAVWFYMKKVYTLTSAFGIVAFAATSLGQSIDGGTTWTGWASKGQSDQLGVYGSGSTTDVYEVFTTAFLFNNNSVSGGAVGGGPTGGVTGFGTGAFSTGAFANGNSIVGVGVRRISGATLPFTPTVRFDLDNDSYAAASSVGGGDGRTSFTSWSEAKDYTVQFEGANSWRGGSLTMQAGNGTSNGGPYDQQAIAGGFGSGVSYDWAFRAFAQGTSSYQMFFDLTAMSALYGTSNPFGLNSNFTGIGSTGSTVRFSLNGLGDNSTVFTVQPVPEPASMAALGLGALALIKRRKQK